MTSVPSFSSKENDVLFSWFIVCCGVVGAINLAKIAPSMGRLIEHMNISLSTSGFIGAIFSTLTLSTGIIGGILIAKYGPRKAMLFGLLISLVGNIIPIIRPNLSILMIGRILEGYGFLLINLAAPVLLNLHTQGNIRGRVMGIWGSFMPAGNAVIILIAPIIYLVSDWQLLWTFSAIYTAIILFFGGKIIPNDPEHFKNQIIGKTSFLIKQTIGRWSIIITGTTFACHSLIFLGTMQFLPYYFEIIAGYTETISFLITVLFCLSSFVGHLFCGYLLQKGYSPEQLIGCAFLIAGCFVSFFFGVFDNFITSSELPWVKLAAIIAVAFFMGLTPPSIFYLISFIAPPSRLTPINYGYMSQIQALGIFVGPFLFGWLVDVSGSWSAIGSTTIFISICGCLCGIFSTKIILRKSIN